MSQCCLNGNRPAHAHPALPVTADRLPDGRPAADNADPITTAHTLLT